MSHAQEILALVFDFDDTLLPDSTTALLASKGIDTARFWSEDARKLVDQEFDPSLAYLELLLARVGKGRELGKLTNDALRKFGASLDESFYVELPRLFTDLMREVAKFRGIEIEFYIISSGLLEVIQGSATVRKYFHGVYACELAEDQRTGLLALIKQCVTFTEKTRYLFEINKGLDKAETRKNPYLVNTNVPEQNRRIPFKNRIYVGDGITDNLMGTHTYEHVFELPDKPRGAPGSLPHINRPLHRCHKGQGLRGSVARRRITRSSDAGSRVSACASAAYSRSSRAVGPHLPAP